MIMRINYWLDDPLLVSCTRSFGYHFTSLHTPWGTDPRVVHAISYIPSVQSRRGKEIKYFSNSFTFFK